MQGCDNDWNLKQKLVVPRELIDVHLILDGLNLYQAILEYSMPASVPDSNFMVALLELVLNIIILRNKFHEYYKEYLFFSL